MLSITNMSSEQASHYHKEEQNYYQQNEEIGRWQGNGAKALGLDGAIKHEQFDRLCNGIDPNEDKVLVDTTKRAGTDLTFSAPKSVSLLMEFSQRDDELAIRKAHDDAVANSIKHIEESYAQTREQINGDRRAVNTNSLVVAKFQHDTSRELDPQLHTHAFVLNMTQKENGDWRALHNDELFKNKMYLGQVYRNELAKNLQDIGYKIEVSNAKQGLFEITGISKELMHEFSGRKEQIEAKYIELKKKYPNMQESKLREMATLESRKTKDKTINRSNIRLENISRAEVVLDLNDMLANIKNQNISKSTLNTQDYLNRAKEILTDKESVFTKEQLLKESLKLSIGTHTRDDFNIAIRQDKELVNFEKNLYSTNEMIEIEKTIIEDVESYQDSLRSIESDEKNANNFLNNLTLTVGQNASAREILLNNDLVMNIQGDAGTGKTYMLKAVNDYVKLSSTSYTLQGLSFTGKASDEIKKDSGINSSTLHSFLNQKELLQNQIYIVDEASMIGSKQMKQLLDRAKQTNSKIVLIGDIKQFQTISAGSIFEQLQKKDFVKTIEMNESMRAKNQMMKSLYLDVKAKKLENAFDTLEKNNMLKESKDLEKIKDEYLKQTQEDKKDTLLIASKNSDRQSLNHLIREAVKDEIKDEVLFKIKESLNLNDTEKHFAQYYKEEQSVFISKAIKGFKAGSEAIIKSIDISSNTLTLIANNGKLLDVDLAKNGDKLSTFENIEKTFGIGDTICFTKNDKKLGIKNGQIATITNIDNNNITFKKQDNSISSINTNNYSYLDHGYAVTDYKAQGQTAQNVIAVVDSAMSNLNALYVQITRAKESVNIFTDNLDILKENSINAQVKTSTLDFIKLKPIDNNIEF